MASAGKKRRTSPERPSEWGQSSRAHRSRQTVKYKAKRVKAKPKVRERSPPQSDLFPSVGCGTTVARNPEKQALRVERGKACGLAAAQRSAAEAEEFDAMKVEVYFTFFTLFHQLTQFRD